MARLRLNAKLRLLWEGLGWGTMPAHVVADELSAGRLKMLHLEAIAPPREVLPVNAVHRTDAALGPAGSWMLERLKEAMPRSGESPGAEQVRIHGLPYRPARDLHPRSGGGPPPGLGSDR